MSLNSTSSANAISRNSERLSESSLSSIEAEDTASTSSSSSMSAKKSSFGGRAQNWDDFSEEIFEKT